EDGPPAALVYQDATPFIGLDEIVPLETAFLRAVQFNTPSPASVAGAVETVFSQARLHMYQGARVVRPGARDIELNPNRRNPGGRHGLTDVLPVWDTARDAVETRQQVTGAFGPTSGGFMDPVDFFRFVLDELADPAVPADRWMPRLLRGPAHGDSHPRNVWVG